MKYVYKTLKFVGSIIILYLFFSIIAVLPAINLMHFKIGEFAKYYFHQIYTYTMNLFHGSFGEYSLGQYSKVRFRAISADILSYFWNSFKLLGIGLLLGTLVSIIAGTFLSVYRKYEKVFSLILMIFNSIPDFIFILILQMLVVFINKRFFFTGIKISSFRDEQAILLPIIAMTTIPMVFFIKEIMNHTSSIITEEYIRTALSKGLSRLAIIKQHVYSNLILYFKGDLIKVISIAIGNLFIIEHLFSIKGITRFMFNIIQFPVWMTSLLFLTVIFIVMYYGLLLILYGFRRLLTGE